MFLFRLNGPKDRWDINGWLWERERELGVSFSSANTYVSLFCKFHGVKTGGIFTWDVNAVTRKRWMFYSEVSDSWADVSIDRSEYVHLAVERIGLSLFSLEWKHSLNDPEWRIRFTPAKNHSGFQVTRLSLQFPNQISPQETWGMVSEYLILRSGVSQIIDRLSVSFRRILHLNLSGKYWHICLRK